jgi:hypothetical protein
LIVIPFLAIATARNTGWTVDLHLSRQAVFHSSALLVSGAFLLAVAIAGYFVRYFGGDWGHALQIELLFAAALFVALVAWSGRFRSNSRFSSASISFLIDTTIDRNGCDSPVRCQPKVLYRASRSGR